MKCPNDSTVLEAGRAEAHTGYGCSTCAGVWLPFSYIASIKYQREFVPETFTGELMASSTGHTRKNCPTGCGCLVECEIHAITLDFCPACSGVWFDKGELKSLLGRYPLNKQATSDTALAGANALFDLFSVFF